MQCRVSIIRAISRDYDSIVAALAGFLIIQVFARHSGIGISPDSVIYMSTATNILDRGVINDFSGWPMMDFPAGYPFFLALVQGLARTEIRHCGPVLNGLLFAGLIFTSGWLMERFTVSSKWYKWALLTIIPMSPCLQEIYSMIWSETLFLLLVLLFIPALRHYLLAPSAGRLLLPALIAALACVTRYAGVSLIMLGGGLILCIRDLDWLRKLLHGLLFGLLSSTLFALNLYRNHRVTGTLTGYREKAITSFGANLHHYGSVLCDWLPFFNGDYTLASFAGAFFILLGTGLFIRRWVLHVHFFSYDNIGAAYFIVYTIFILATASLSRFQQLDSRLLSPLCIPWLWAGSSWIPGWVRGLSSRGRPIRWGLSIACLGLFASFQAGQWRSFQMNWEGIKYAGIPGYTEEQWRQSPTMDFIRHNADMHKPGAPVYSNAYEGIWFLTGVHSDLIPHKEFIQDIREMLHEDHFYVIWFNDSANEDLLSIDSIMQYKQVAREYTFDDGKVYLFTKK